MDQVTINPVEVASEIAHEMTRDELMTSGIIRKESGMWRQEDGIYVYQGFAQDVFNKHYDHIYNVVVKNSPEWKASQ